MRWFYCKPSLREAKPGGFQTGGFPTFFGKSPGWVADPGLFPVGALNRPRKRKGTNRENPRTIPEQIGKIPEKSGKSQKGQERTKKGQKNPDREAPPFETAPFAALDKLNSSTASVSAAGSEDGSVLSAPAAGGVPSVAAALASASGLAASASASGLGSYTHGSGTGGFQPVARVSGA